MITGYAGFRKHFFKRLLLFWKLCPTAFIGWIELHGVPFLSCSQFLPRTRSDKPPFIHSAEVRCFTHKRSKPCCTTGRCFPSIHFGLGPSHWFKPITTLLRDLACPPFWFAQATVSPELRHSPRRASNYCPNPTIHHRHQVPGELRGPTLCRQATAKSKLHPDSPVRYVRWHAKRRRSSWLSRPIPSLMVNA
jgi:hypothetical protein